MNKCNTTFHRSTKQTISDNALNETCTTTHSWPRSPWGFVRGFTRGFTTVLFRTKVKQDRTKKAEPDAVKRNIRFRSGVYGSEMFIQFFDRLSCHISMVPRFATKLNQLGMNAAREVDFLPSNEFNLRHKHLAESRSLDERGNSSERIDNIFSPEVVILSLFQRIQGLRVAKRILDQSNGPA